MDGEYGFVKDQYNTSTNRAMSIINQIDGLTVFDYLTSDISFVTSNGVDIYVVGINSIGNFSNPVIFNRLAYEDSTAIDSMASLYKVVVENDKITEILEPSETAIIPKDGYILVMNESMGASVVKKLSVGRDVTLEVKSNYDVENIKMAISGGGGAILRAGQLVEEGLIVSRNSRHPRTAVGITSDGNTLVSMVVDGRGGASIGATHAELGSYLLEYDVKDAMHFDGGGSSTLSTRELGNFELDSRNTPSDGYERPVVNGLAIVSNAPKTSNYQLYLTASQNRSFINSPINLELKAFDSNYHPVEVNQSQVAWGGMSGGFGTINDMVFTPKASGQVTLTAYYNGKSTNINLDISDQLIDLEVVPKVINFEDGSQSFTVIGTDEEGYKSIIDNSLLEWTLDEPVGTITDGRFEPGDVERSSRLDVTYKGIKEVAYIVSGETTKALVQMNQIEVDTLVYPESVTGEVALRSSDGIQSLAIDYDFIATDISQAVYAVFENVGIKTSVDKLRMTVDGIQDGGVQMKAHVTDATGEQYTVTYLNKGDGIVEATLPKALSYPIELARVYVVAVGTTSQIKGSLLIESIETVSKLDESDLFEVVDIKPIDSLYEVYPSTDSDTVTLFGATGGRNRLLDEVVLEKVYTVLNKSDYAIYAGTSVVDEEKITNQHLIYKNSFEVVDLPSVRIITLAMSEGSVISTDSSQWSKLNSALSGSTQENVIIVGNSKLVDSSKPESNKEGKFIHETLKDFCKKIW